MGAARESKRERTRAATGPVIVDDGPGDRAPFGSERRPSRRRARRLRPRPAAKAPNAEKSDIRIACPGDPLAMDGDRGRREIEAGVAPSSRFE